MLTIETKYSPSVNILRDQGRLFDYIQTTNAQKSFQSIFNNLKAGVKSHIIIGAYGTGKSSFLLAFEQTLSGKASIFADKQLVKSNNQFEFINVVGEYSSLENHLAALLKIEESHSVSDIIGAIDKKYELASKSNKGLIVVIDEFGKFLEYAAKSNPASEIYFIQQLAEWANDPGKNVS